MKKILITLITIITVLILSFTNVFSKKVSAETTNSDKTGLGVSIDSVKSSYLDTSELKTGSPIFNTSWLNGIKSNLVFDNAIHSDTKAFSSTSFEEISAKVSANYEGSNEINGNTVLFSGNAKTGFSIQSSLNYRNFEHQYYYELLGVFDKYAYSLPNYSSNLSAYRSNLHPDYVNAVTNMFNANSYSAAKSFFTTYGTHVIGKGIYGAKVEVYYSAVSDTIDLDIKFNEKITKKVEASISSAMNAGTSTSIDLATLLKTEETNIEDSFKVRAWGGNPFSVTSYDDLKDGYSNWVNSIENKSTLIRTSTDGLLPLWNLLPSKYNTTTYKDRLENWFEDYAKEYNDALYKSYNYEGAVYKSIRKEMKEIDDTGRYQHDIYDLINIDTVLRKSLETYKKEGYKKLNITVKFEMKEINKGYQYICLYNGTGKSDAYKVCPDIEYEYYGGSLGKKFEVREFLFSGIDIEKFTSKPIVIRYGASGSGADTWQNREMCIKVEPVGQIQENS